MTDIIYLRAYRAAIFEGSRDEPAWSAKLIAECRRNHEHPAVRERIDEIARRARAEADACHIEVRLRAAHRRSNSTKPGGGEAA